MLYPAAELVLPRNMCPLITSSYGLASSDSCPFFLMADALVGETTCDGKKKVFELLADRKPLHVMRLPTSADHPDALASWQRELHRLAGFLQSISGVAPATEALAQEIRLSNETRTLLQRAVAVFREDTPPLTWSDMLVVLSARDFLVDRAEYTQRLRKLIATMEALGGGSNGGSGAAARRSPRILITGTPMAPETAKVMRLTEQVGGLVVCHDACSGIKPFARLVPELADPFEALARFTLDIPCACMSPNPGRLELLRREVESYRVDGVIDAVWQGCHTFNVESELVKRTCAGLGVRYLKLETDYSEADVGQLETRIEAFIESIAD